MDTEIFVEIRPDDGSWEKAEKLIEKICEAYKTKNCTLRIEVKGVRES